MTAQEFFERGSILYGSGRYTEALEAFSAAIELSPERSASFYNRGNTHSAMHNFPEAIKDYDKAILLNGQDSSAYVNRGVAYLLFEGFRAGRRGLQQGDRP